MKNYKNYLLVALGIAISVGLTSFVRIDPFGSAVSAQTQSERTIQAPQQWEYHAVAIDSGSSAASLSVTLDQVGRNPGIEGGNWELAAITTNNIAIFKRPYNVK